MLSERPSALYLPKDLRRETPCFESLLESKHKLGDKPLITVKTGLALHVKTTKIQAVGFISPKCRTCGM